MQDVQNILELKDIRKIYPGVVALDGVSLNVRKGEIHGLVGENGAGKSTLIKTCSGAIVPDGGSIVIEGKEFTSLTPKLSEEQGIAVIYQEFNLVNDLSVAENIFLGNAIRKGITIDRKAMEKKSAEIFSQLGVDIDPKEYIYNLTVGYQQMVEIAKAISRNSKIIIMDEPSAALTKAEVATMIKMVNRLKEAGTTVIYISHRLDEIFDLTDRVTVLRDGEKITTLETDQTDTDELVTLMVGREMKETYPSRADAVRPEILLEVDSLTGNGVSDISFEAYRGEILGFAGLVGAGRTEMAELLFGAKPKTAGTVKLNEREINIKSPEEAIEQGIALVPEDRKRQGVLLENSVLENISVAILKRISKGSIINKKKEKELAKNYKEELQIKTPHIEQLVKNLSGGNQQKVVLAKWLASNPELIIFDEPTRGIDVGAKYEIYKIINDLVEQGKTVLFISSEMEELIGMSDRIVVLAEGRLTGTIDKEDFSQELIMQYASQAKKDDGNDR